MSGLHAPKGLFALLDFSERAAFVLSVIDSLEAVKYSRSEDFIGLHAPDSLFVLSSESERAAFVRSVVDSLEAGNDA